MAADAGAHIYSDNKNDVVYANKSFLAIHSISKGKRIISLPYKANVYDLFDNKCVAENAKSFELYFKKPDTKLFNIEEKK